jgi:hypothetical protein
MLTMPTSEHCPFASREPEISITENVFGKG